MKEKYKLAFMKMAEVFSETSEATRLKVGALLVKNGAIISMGINGTPAGWHTNQCEDSDGNTEWFVRHAEQSAIDKMTRSTETTDGAVMFVTHSPCLPCSIRMKEAGIKSVYFRNLYRDQSGIEFLTTNGIPVERVE